MTADPDLTLYHRTGTRAGRVKMLMDQMELDYQLQPITEAEAKDPRYLALNPFGTVPTLVHGERVILESGAQMMYLADLVPEKGFAPPIGTPERGTYYEWFVLNGATLEPLGTAGFLNPEDQEARAGIMLAMEVLQNRLVMPYAMGESVTAVDVMIHWQLTLVAKAGMLSAAPKAEAYVQGLNGHLNWDGY